MVEGIGSNRSTQLDRRAPYDKLKVESQDSQAGRGRVTIVHLKY